MEDFRPGMDVIEGTGELSPSLVGGAGSSASSVISSRLLPFIDGAAVCRGNAAARVVSLNPSADVISTTVS